MGCKNVVKREIEAKISGFGKPRSSKFPSILAMGGEQVVDYGESRDSNNDRSAVVDAGREDTQRRVDLRYSDYN
jgi:hypothetical protein